jgi:hypothetical protein
MSSQPSNGVNAVKLVKGTSLVEGESRTNTGRESCPESSEGWSATRAASSPAVLLAFDFDKDAL